MLLSTFEEKILSISGQILSENGWGNENGEDDSPISLAELLIKESKNFEKRNNILFLAISIAQIKNEIFSTSKDIVKSDQERLLELLKSTLAHREEELEISIQDLFGEYWTLIGPKRLLDLPEESLFDDQESDCSSNG